MQKNAKAPPLSAAADEGVSCNKIMNIPHINIGTNTEGNIFVSVEDTELFDYVEDYLIEKCNIEYEHVIPSESNGVPVYTMFFSKNIKEKDIESMLVKLPTVEIEEIYNINNPK